jgi:hypothetical protein
MLRSGDSDKPKFATEDLLDNGWNSKDGSES